MLHLSSLECLNRALKDFAWSAHQTLELLLQACWEGKTVGEHYHCTSELRATWA